MAEDPFSQPSVRGLCPELAEVFTLATSIRPAPTEPVEEIEAPRHEETPISSRLSIRPTPMASSKFSTPSLEIGQPEWEMEYSQPPITE